jgi:hypothetical protein
VRPLLQVCAYSYLRVCMRVCVYHRFVFILDFSLFLSWLDRENGSLETFGCGFIQCSIDENAFSSLYYPFAHSFPLYVLVSLSLSLCVSACFSYFPFSFSFLFSGIICEVVLELFWSGCTWRRVLLLLSFFFMSLSHDVASPSH